MFGWDNSHDEDVQACADPSGSSDTARAFCGHGLVADTRIASSLGWRPVGDIVAGDKVLTFDNGMQIVSNVRRTKLRISPEQDPEQGPEQIPEHMTQAAMPVLVPIDALGNRVALSLMPDQGVLVESDAASDAHGDPFAVVPAAALIGFRGISRNHQPREYDIITLCFATPQLIYAEAGTLVYCPAAFVDLLDMIGPDSTLYEVLSASDAARLVECMHYEDLSAAIRPAGKVAAHAA